MCFIILRLFYGEVEWVIFFKRAKSVGKVGLKDYVNIFGVFIVFFVVFIKLFVFFKIIVRECIIYVRFWLVVFRV